MALCTESSLNARACEEFDTQVEECIFCTCKTPQDGNVLIGCLYRSPNTRTEENDERIFQLLKSEKVHKCDKICMMGDFNFLSIKWDGSYSGEKAEIIQENLNNAFLIQQVKNPTRRREGQRPTLDDWVLTNSEDLISEIAHQDAVGKRDHDSLVFEINIHCQETESKSKHAYNLSK